MKTTPKTWFNFRNSTDKIHLAIEGEIGGYGVTSKEFKAQLAAQDQSKDLEVSIFSGGGEVFEGNEIYLALKAWPKNVEIKIGALCASIATVVACAGHKVTMAKNGLYMVHNPWGVVVGEAKDLRKTADALDKLKGTITGVYVAKTGRKEEDLAALMDEETWIDGNEAKALGFVDEVDDDDGDEDPEEILNAIQPGKFKNASRILDKLQKIMSAKAKAEPQLTPPTSAKPNDDLMKSYQSGNARIFNMLIALSVLNDFRSGPVARFYNDATLTPEQIAQKIKDEARTLYQAKLARTKEIWDTVKIIKDRDKRDFSELAEEFIAEDKAPNEFLAATLRSDKFKDTTPAPEQNRIDVIEPLDGLKDTPGFAFVTSDAFKASVKHGKLNSKCAAEVRNFVPKNVAVGGTKVYEQVPGVVDQAVRPLTVEGLLSSGSTDGNTITYLQETEVNEIATGNIAEGGTLHQADISYEQKTTPVADIGDFIPVPEGLLADLPAIASLINTRLPYLVDRAVEFNLLNADGTGGNFTGILNSAGLQTIDLADIEGDGAFRTLDLLRKMQTKVRWQNMNAGKAQGGYEPDGYVIHPADWEAIELLKDDNGQYYRTNPFTMVDGELRVWGKRVAVTPAVAQGSPVLGAFKLGGTVFNRQGMLIEATNSDGTNFQKRIVTIRAARRLALAVWRPANFVEATGVNPQD